MEKVADQRLRLYGLGLTLGMGTASAVLWMQGVAYLPWLTLAVGATALALAAFRPAALGPLYRATSAWGNFLGTTLAWLLITPLYFLLFTPLALLYRLLGWDSMGRPDAGSWRPVPPRDNDPRQMERLW